MARKSAWTVLASAKFSSRGTSKVRLEAVDELLLGLNTTRNALRVAERGRRRAVARLVGVAAHVDGRWCCSGSIAIVGLTGTWPAGHDQSGRGELECHLVLPGNPVTGEQSQMKVTLAPGDVSLATAIATEPLGPAASVRTWSC